MRTTRIRTLATGLAGAVAVAVLITGGTVVAPPPAAATTTVTGTVAKPAVGTFDLDKYGVKAYEDLITLIRVQNQQLSANTPVTPAPTASDADPAGYFSVALVAGGRRIELVIRRDDLYLVGWYQADQDRAGDADVYFRFRHDRSGSPYDFRRTTRTRIVDLTFTGSYLDLGYPAEKRKALNLGGGALIKALQLLSGTNGQQPNEALVVTIQMVLEAARFHPLFEHLREHWDEWGAPPPALVDLQNNWGDLSQDWWRGQDARVAITVTYAGMIFKAVADILTVVAVLHYKNCGRKPFAAAAAAAENEACPPTGGRFLVTVEELVFDNPGDAGSDFEPYGSVSLVDGQGTPIRTAWQQADHDIPHVVRVPLTDARAVVDSETGVFCFHASVRESDSSNGDDDLSSQVSDVCGTGGVGTFRGDDGTVTIYYAVQRLVRPCLSWATSIPCQTSPYQYLYHVTRVDFGNPGDAGDPEPYGFIKVKPGGGSAYSLWEQSSDNPPTMSHWIPPTVLAPLRVGSSAQPCFYVNVEESDSSGRNDWLTPFGTFCGDESHLRLTEGENWVEIHYEFLQLIPGE
ncbi:hypothetical protein MCAG_04545 [Micromonospora sp. ATCC 39149]|uniref:Ribosome inactivating protein n=1 Tax=Micromonospora carbonacea TaxID=47853 RepID=A0A7D5Y9J8_9ACTN|nr:ribosome-inactivating family protein [Micromonospora sp. ATCC 39149]EEP74218.1 hypothetical protein MCAG_04545 [Micromonospora sp. ATCC 39149]QLK00062.1 hypothetical protein HZU44_08360 [Micromonospora carbonacea]